MPVYLIIKPIFFPGSRRALNLYPKHCLCATCIVCTGSGSHPVNLRTKDNLTGTRLDRGVSNDLQCIGQNGLRTDFILVGGGGRILFP